MTCPYLVSSGDSINGTTHHCSLAAQAVRERDAEIAALRRKVDMLLAEEPAAERTLDAIDAAALELTGPWPAGTCSREAAIALPENYRKLATEAARLREALEKALAAMWDSYYGKGIAVEYVRSVTAECRSALTKEG